MVEPLGDAMDDRVLERVLVEDRRIEERRQQRIALDRLGASSRTPVQIGSTG